MADENLQTRIKKLSLLLINQLAAGEVVTRPAAVVKELLENAIDAHATDIEVRITQGGMGMIEVVDNGEGIHPDDMVMAITRHATSKVADIANLQGISTLGFRGEALAATAAVSRLTLLSSHDDSGIGRQLQVTGVLAETPKLTPVVRTRGTTVIVKDLYFNVPARRGNLKSIATEFVHIETIVREVALVHANVTLNLFHDNKKRLSLFAHSQNDNQNSLSNIYNRLPLARLEQALGINLTDDAVAINIDLSALIQASQMSSQSAINQDTVAHTVAHIVLPLVPPNSPLTTNSASISGWLWPITEASATMPNVPKLLYINSRLVKEPIISNQLRQLAQSAGLDSLGYALNFELPLQWLNVNVHPSKQRIKISSLNNIMAHLSHNVSLQLKDANFNINSSAITDTSGFNNLHYKVENDCRDSAFTESLSSQKIQHPSQVKESLEPYQRSIVSQPLSPSNYANPKSNLLLDSTATHTFAAFAINSFELPHCLEVIDNLAELPESDQKNSLSNLPWLLFYSLGELVLISQQAWQASLTALFEVNSLAINDNVKDVADINQQLLSYATQMSKADFIAFKTDIDNILSTNAIKTLDSTQLIALMLFPYSL